MAMDVLAMPGGMTWGGIGGDTVETTWYWGSVPWEPVGAVSSSKLQQLYMPCEKEAEHYNDYCRLFDERFRMMDTIAGALSNVMIFVDIKL